MRKGKIWLLTLIVLTGLEMLVLGYHGVTAKAPTVPQEKAAATTGENAAQLPARERAPSGNDSQTVQRYYDYLYQQSLQKIPEDRTQILWSGPFWIALWAAVLILFFFFYANYFQHAHRESGELYAPVSFAGAILERIGTVALFSKIVWTAIVFWGLYYIVTHILWGQVY